MLLFMQLAVILLACRAVSWVFVRIGQSPVVAEMVAGVLLGPSLLGLLAPELSASLFPAASKPILFALAQIALALYMFLVGCEFDLELMKGRVGKAASVSLAGIAAPFALGAGLAWFLADRQDLFPAATEPFQAMLFLGAAMSITAFPMLARIIYERGLTGTPLGTLTLAAGAVDDAAAWCVLAVVLASFKGQASIAVLAIGGSVLFAAFVMGPLRWVLPRWIGKVQGDLNSGQLVLVLALLMLAAWCTDMIGIYAVFGAFLLGLAMPRGDNGGVPKALERQLMPLTTSLLLPCFFTYSGLNTQINLLTEPGLWGLAAVVLAAAVLGKGGACYAVARWQGMSHPEAAAVGSLMNARGLMELIILNIGLQAGLITPTLFTVMVIMAIVTTLMATPLFNRVYASRLKGAGLVV
ncbi:cation:proton antiporter [Inhella gelatinilytica]|uniref:cation:proton antiporter n=1 Tax=Inhella gelatinilytica TaxID=2795030 RepID=UPI0028735CB3|nr:cation:proton antiporter [Inhella gelatinilytica]